jgi:hypothetical protein
MKGKTQLHAGIGRCDITPAPGTPQGGWGAQTHERGLGADMPMYATALVLASESEPVAIVDIDSIAAPPMGRRPKPRRRTLPKACTRLRTT